jgi:hypothetical protein
MPGGRNMGASADAETGSHALHEARADLRPTGFDPARGFFGTAASLREYATAIDGGYAGELCGADADCIRNIACDLEDLEASNLRLVGKVGDAIFDALCPGIRFMPEDDERYQAAARAALKTIEAHFAEVER